MGKKRLYLYTYVVGYVGMGNFEHAKKWRLLPVPDLAEAQKEARKELRALKRTERRSGGSFRVEAVEVREVHTIAKLI